MLTRCLIQLRVRVVLRHRQFDPLQKPTPLVRGVKRALQKFADAAPVLRDDVKRAARSGAPPRLRSLTIGNHQHTV
jgi:hypothetical protein